MYCIHVFRLLAVISFCLKGSDLVNGAECAGKKFDNKASFCCGSTIHRKTNGDGLLWDCCEGANKPYSHIEECCGSEIRTRSLFLGCCKNGFYNTSTHNCCEESGKVLRREGSRSCCGRSTFNPSTHLCCGNEHTLYDREANTACCGSRIYNQTTHVCVGNDRVVKKGLGPCGSENSECCKGGMIDTRTLNDYLCCYRNQIFPPSDTHYCDGYKVLENHEIMCGEKKLDSNNMICCNNVSHVKKYRQSDCCGTQLIDGSKKGCCNDTVHYRLDKKKCCGAKVIRKAQQCCGGAALRVQTHVCCNKTNPVRKQHRKQNQCCTTTPFDNTLSKCYKGNVVSLFTCGGKPMNVDKDLCCGNKKLFKNAKKTKKCCAARAIKASCKCCLKGRKKCCGTKTKRKQKTLNCRTGQRWSRISDLVDAKGCLQQAFVVKKQKKRYQQKKQLLGRKEKASWKLGESCDFIKKFKKFVIVKTSAGVYFPIQPNRKNGLRLTDIEKNCTGP